MYETKMTAAETKRSPSNNALWLGATLAKFEVAPAPYTPPKDNEIVVKNKAIAVNPIDWSMQLIGDFAFSWLRYPLILGSDVAGEVFEIGKSVTRFKVGDRVVGHAVGFDKSRNSAAEGGFQQYTVLLEDMVSPIPDSVKYENAAVLPLGLSTAACGLFQKDQLALNYPSSNPKPTGKTVLIWGGSTSVGSNAIQLALAAGYRVITTASTKNFDYVTKLGASRAFDYKNPKVVQDIIKSLQGETLAGALAIGAGSTKPCLEIVHKCTGVKFVSVASSPISLEKAPLPRKIKWLIPTMVRMIASIISLSLDARMKGIKTKFIFGTSLIENEVGKVIYVDFLPKALADGTFVAAPEPLVVGHGLDQIPVALETQRKGVSAKKVVVTL